MPCAEAIAAKGHNVLGYDISPRTSDSVTVVDSIEAVVSDRDIVFIAVPTPHEQRYDGRIPSAHLEPRDFGYDIVKQCITEANKYMKPDQLLVLISIVMKRIWMKNCQ